ncbi:C45 family autoproteolytic acyltransferase/hydolase [Ornithinibacillus halophilus]|uniref:Predicted choloylglycine hydrolase n=1 Tax=Ornithinibacillus halophilus TaxID=930117 RepID=A0A1M5LHG9_9BACI|nr:C45 family peptidase [Ornithinibacillus halophilus]SHG64390.1 Predicted choloylglycine hydrolase [Ornithinibacillus halophilus]
MSHFSVDIFQSRNNAYEIGFELGSFVRKKPVLFTFQQFTKDRINVKTMEEIFNNTAPHLVDVLKGLSDRLSIPYERACALFSGFDVPKPDAMGCTSYMTSECYVRNYDFSPDLYDGIFSLIQPDNAYATAGYNLQLLGLHDGVNEKGLVAGLHFVNNDRYEEGISAWMSIRILLDCCSTVEEAVQMLKQIPHATCYNFSLADSLGNKAVVEASPDSVSVRDNNAECESCVNHFQTESMIHFNRKNIDGSLRRKKYLDTFSHHNLKDRELFDHFRNPESPLFFKNYNELFGTLHTFFYRFEDSRILTAIANGENILDFNFNDWVNGKDLRISELVGEIME